MKKGDKVELSAKARRKMLNLTFPLDAKGIVISEKGDRVVVEFTVHYKTEIPRSFIRKVR